MANLAKKTELSKQLPGIKNDLHTYKGGGNGVISIFIT